VKNFGGSTVNPRLTLPGGHPPNALLSDFLIFILVGDVGRLFIDKQRNSGLMLAIDPRFPLCGDLVGDFGGDDESFDREDESFDGEERIFDGDDIVVVSGDGVVVEGGDVKEGVSRTERGEPAFYFIQKRSL
jgi:hypothetical protein